jgi:hypothetical protein
MKSKKSKLRFERKHDGANEKMMLRAYVSASFLLWVLPVLASHGQLYGAGGGDKRKEENKSFNGSTHSLTKFTVLDLAVALHKDINCSYLEIISPK